MKCGICISINEWVAEHSWEIKLVILQVGAQDQQRQQHRGICYPCKILGCTLDLLN